MSPAIVGQQLQHQGPQKADSSGPERAPRTIQRGGRRFKSCSAYQHHESLPSPCSSRKWPGSETRRGPSPAKLFFEDRIMLSRWLGLLLALSLSVALSGCLGTGSSSPQSKTGPTVTSISLSPQNSALTVSKTLQF